MTESLTVMKLIHDLKSPLGALKILERKANLEPEHRQLLNRALTFLESLIGNVRRNERDYISGSEIETALRQIIEEKQFVHGLFSIHIHVNRQQNALRIRGSLFDLRRVMENLLENAIVASKVKMSGHPIEVAFVFSKRSGKIICQDFAGGVPQEIINGISAVGFGQTKSGWGLGLSIVQEICLRNDWKFSLLSRQGVGAQATIRLC